MSADGNVSADSKAGPETLYTVSLEYTLQRVPDGNRAESGFRQPEGWTPTDKVSLRQQFVDDFGGQHAGQSLIETLMFVGQTFVVIAQLVQHGRVEVANMNGIADDVV